MALPFTERALQEHDIPLLALIDRTELIEQCYRLEDGWLTLYDERFDMHGWPEGEAERDALTLHDSFARGGWLHGVFVGPTLVAAAVVDNRVIHNAGRAMLQLKFLHVSHAYRGHGLGGRLFQLACEHALQVGAQGLYVSATPSRNTVDFYQRQGCQLLEWPDPDLLLLEPEDIHLAKRL